MYRLACFIWLFLLGSLSLVAQGLRSSISLEYPQSLPHREVLVSEHFEIYYEPSAHEMAKYVLEKAIESTTSIELALGYRLSGKVEIQLFHNPELAASTPAHYIQDPFSQNTGGTTFLELGSINLVFHGDLDLFNADIRRGISRMLIHEMLYGGTTQESIRYTALLHLPSWFVDGLSAYLAGPWTIEDDDRLRSLIQSGKRIQIDDLTDKDQALVGKSIWNYIALLKGEGSFQRMLYLIRLTRKLENSVYFIFSWNVRELLQNWYAFSIGTYAREGKRRMPREPEMKPIEQGKIQEFVQSGNNFYILSSKGNYYYIHKRGNQRGEYKEVFNLYFVKNEYRFRGIPLIAGDENGGCVVMYFNGSDYELIYIDEIGKSTPIGVKTRLDIVREINYNARDNTLILLGFKGIICSVEQLNLKSGMSDFFVQSKGEIRDISVYEGGNKWLFSYRERAKEGDWNIYEWQRENEEFPGRSVVASEFTNEYDAQYLDLGHIVFLSDVNGIVNSYVTKVNSNVWNALTDYPYGIKKAIYDQGQYSISELVQLGNDRFWYISDLDTSSINALTHHIPQLTYFREKPPEYKIEEFLPIEADSFFFDTSGQIYFQTGFPDVSDINYSRAREPEKTPAPYVLKNVSFLKPVILITQLDNGWFNTYYIPTFISLKEVLNTPIGLVFAIKIKEISNKYDLFAGGKISRNFNQFDYFFNLNRNFQKSIVKTEYFRQTRRIFSTETGYGKVNSDQIKISYQRKPFKQMQWDIGLHVRSDRYISLSENQEALGKATINFVRIGPEASWIVNTSRTFKEGLYKGWKSKVYVSGNVGASSNANMALWGLDTRFGWKIQKHIYLMQRLQYESSAGNSKVQYVLGGLEGWLFPDQIFKEPLLSQTGFYRMSSSFRGSGYNIRNGNSFLCYNFELRYRPLGHLFKLNARPNWMENLLLIGFFDLGSAWYGSSPFHLRSPLNYTQIQSGTMVINLYNRRQPFVFVTGFGLRTSLFGYYFKYDRGFGRIESVWKEGINYLSVGRDF